jgi:hypothetical protein
MGGADVERASEGAIRAVAGAAEGHQIRRAQMTKTRSGPPSPPPAHPPESPGVQDRRRAWPRRRAARSQTSRRPSTAARDHAANRGRDTPSAVWRRKPPCLTRKGGSRGVSSERTVARRRRRSARRARRCSARDHHREVPRGRSPRPTQVGPSPRRSSPRPCGQRGVASGRVGLTSLVYHRAPQRLGQPRRHTFLLSSSSA